jgi:hypothetical protein
MFLFNKYDGLAVTALLLAGCKVSPHLRPSEKMESVGTPAITSQIEEVVAVAPPEQTAGKQQELTSSPALVRDLTPFVVSARASSLERDRFVAEHAFDGNRFTRWASSANDSEFIEAYFDRAVAISSVTIRWERARAAVYTLLGRAAPDVWSPLAKMKQPAGLVDTFNFSSAPTVTAIRIACEKRATEWGHSIYEVEMKGIVEGTPPTNNLIGYFPPARNEKQARERNAARRLMAQAAAAPKSSRGLSDDEFLDLLERHAFAYFWHETNPTNGLTRDRGANFDTSEDYDIASLAAVGFALSAYPIGVERGWISRKVGRERTVTTLRTLARGNLRQIHGFFPHFVHMDSGKMIPDTEISTIDTALMLAGVVVAMEYFKDAEVLQLAREIFERVDWPAAAQGHPHFVSHGWDYNGNILGSRWGSFTEGVLIYVLALASPAHPLPPASWDAIDRHMGEYCGYRFVVEHGFQSMFRYQYPALWYDFRGKIDRQGVDFFENATIAMLAMRQYCIDLAPRFPKSYGPDLWGLSAADGPGDMYMIFGFPPGNPYSPTDGTIVPYAIAGSLPFAPQHVLRALRKLYDDFRDVAWGKYGLPDSLNPSLDFVARDMIGIDAGTILLGIENYRSGLIWDLFMRNAWIKQFAQKVGWFVRPIAADDNGPIDLARNAQWRMMPGPATLPLPPADDPRWTSVALPDFWENLGAPFDKNDGDMWFETDFVIAKTRLAHWTRDVKPVELVIGAIDDGDEVFLNGAKIGGIAPDAFSARLQRCYPTPLHLLRAGQNTLTIRVTDAGGKGGIWLPPIELGPARQK